MVRAALIAFALFAQPSERWVRIGPDSAQHVWYVDAYSMPAERGASAKPWFKLVPPAGEVTEQLLRIGVDCRTGQVHTLQGVTRYKNGAAVDIALDPRPEPPSPESMGENILQLICSKN